ncbi:MAG TPA: CcmD family protein [Chitinophagaceae bacterium]|nr:CcmD family protein [Chitinophagaceae bacterium]
MKKIISLLFLLCAVLVAFAQGGNTGADGPVEMADAMRSNGKIYVVVAVLLTILLGLFIYLFRLDRKISRLEKDKSLSH